MNLVKKVTPLFSDVEGTILEENMPDIKQAFNIEKVNELLKQFDEYQKITDSKIRLYLVSPMSKPYMVQLLKMIDSAITRYNIRNNSDIDIVYSATAEDDLSNPMHNYYNTDDRIVPYKEDSHQLLSYGMVGSGKDAFVNSVLNTLANNKDLCIENIIYSGNGRNDILSIQRVNKLKNGFTICPKNSRRALKAEVQYASDKEDCAGFADGMKHINEILKNRYKKINGKDKSQDDDFVR